MKEIIRSGEKTIVRQRVPLSDTDLEPVIMTGVGASVISILAVAMPMNLIAHIDVGLCFLAAGGVGAGVASAVFGFFYANEVESEADSYAKNQKAGFLNLVKTFGNIVFPFGQKINVGIPTKVTQPSNRDITEMTNLRYHSGEQGSHLVKSSIKFTPWGSYIQQEFTVEPIGIWDAAFDSTMQVHEFSKK